MCFKNLPIEFDAAGNATLKAGVANPYSYSETPLRTPIEDDPERMKELFARNGSVRRVDFDPVTRVAGALAFHTVVDLDSREVLETAFGITPPPMGVVARNLLQGVEYLYDHPIHLSLLAGPDFSEAAVRETNPEIWEQARNRRCPGR